jgi:endonuclease YncB( thermonuclease family)
MVDVVFVPRSRWRRARWRIVGGRRAPRRLGMRRPAGRARRFVRRTSRLWGFAALAALCAGALLLHLGYLGGAAAPVAQRISAVATDGDTLGTADGRIRILGIDAPELLQICRDEHGHPWACGREAHARLRALVASGLLECRPSSADRYGRTLATCSTRTTPDIGEAMVRAGYAVSFMSVRYWLAELDARWNKRGLWRGSFDRPQAWRRGVRRAG